MRYFIELSYNGKDYHGWQSQPNEKSVQEELEKSLSTLLKEKVKVTGCGRTDSGVHAEQFFLHFDLERPLEEQNFKHRLNSFLPEDIVIFGIREVSDAGHARFSALSRSYEYRIFLGKTAFSREEICQLPSRALDLEAMNKAAALLLKHKDFKCFSRSKTDVTTYDCTVTEAYWRQNGAYLTFYISANRFLRNMVRAIVGTMLEVGTGKMDIAEVERIILSRDRTQAGPSAKARGLFLTRVAYPEDIYIN